MKKNWLLHAGLALGLFLTLAAAPASAQSYEAEIDCGGVWSAGDIVPLTVRLEEQGFISHDLTVIVDVNVPGMGEFTVVDAAGVLGPNQDLALTKSLGLPMSAPSGQYRGSVTADDGSLVMFDTCTFNVN